MKSHFFGYGPIPKEKFCRDSSEIVCILGNLTAEIDIWKVFYFKVLRKQMNIVAVRILLQLLGDSLIVVETKYFLTFHDFECEIT